MSKQPPPAPIASAIGPCPTVIQTVGRLALEVYPGPMHHPTIPYRTRIFFGWLFLGLTALRDSISVYIGPSPPEKGRKKREMIDERKNVQTAPTRTYCKRSRALPYSHPNKWDALALEVYPAPSHHPTTPYRTPIRHIPTICQADPNHLDWLFWA